jgi:hypothetical protein
MQTRKDFLVTCWRHNAADLHSSLEEREREERGKTKKRHIVSPFAIALQASIALHTCMRRTGRNSAALRSKGLSRVEGMTGRSVRFQVAFFAVMLIEVDMLSGAATFAVADAADEEE